MLQVTIYCPLVLPRSPSYFVGLLGTALQEVVPSSRLYLRGAALTGPTLALALALVLGRLTGAGWVFLGSCRLRTTTFPEVAP